MILVVLLIRLLDGVPYHYARPQGPAETVSYTSRPGAMRATLFHRVSLALETGRHRFLERVDLSRRLALRLRHRLLLGLGSGLLLRLTALCCTRHGTDTGTGTGITRDRTDGGRLAMAAPEAG